MATDRITEVRIRGLRTLADVRLKLGGLTVLIGENGSGKSSLIEAFEILRKASEPEFLSRLSYIHGGWPNLLRAGASELGLQVSAEVMDIPLEYSFALSVERSTVVVQQEELRAELPGIGRRPIVQRVRDSLVLDMPYRLPGEPPFSGSVPGHIGAPVGSLMFGGRLVFALSAQDERQLEMFGQQHPHPQPLLDRFAGLLRGIHVQQTLAIKPYWVGREQGDRFSLREPATVAPAPTLSRSAENINSCFQRLKNESAQHWAETMDLVRLGLGEDVESINTESPFGGSIGLSLKLRAVARPIYAEALSDGQLAYLAFVALARLPGEPSLIAFDEPEAHFHPHLLVRVLEIFESLAEGCPVVLATHSDRLLDELSDPAASAVLCSLDEQRATRLRQPDAAVLARWMERYRGLGDLRSAGYESTVMEPGDE